MSNSQDQDVPVRFTKSGFFGDRGLVSHFQLEVKPDDVNEKVFYVTAEAAEFFSSTGRATLVAPPAEVELEDADAPDAAPDQVETADSQPAAERETAVLKRKRKARRLSREAGQEAGDGQE